MIEYYDAVFKPSRFLLWITGTRPFRHNVRPLVYFSFSFITLVTISTAVSFLHDKTFIDTVDIIITQLATVYALIRLTTFAVYESDLRQMYASMKSFWPIEDDSKFGKTCRDILKHLNRLQVFLIIQPTLLSTIISAHGFVTGEHTLHMYRPAVVPEMLFLTFVNAYVFFVTSIGIGFDLYFLALTIVLTVQYKILNKSLYRSFSGNAKQKYSIENCVEQSSLLKEIIVRMNTIFGPMLLVHMWIVIFELSMLMYIVYESKGNVLDFMKYYVMCFSFAVDMFAYYICPAQILTNEVNKMFNEAYLTQWYESSLSHQKSLLTILSGRESTGVITSSGKLVEINFPTCTSIFKTCFSVFTFLVHMKERKSG